MHIDRRTALASLAGLALAPLAGTAVAEGEPTAITKPFSGEPIAMMLYPGISTSSARTTSSEQPARASNW